MHPGHVRAPASFLAVLGLGSLATTAPSQVGIALDRGWLNAAAGSTARQATIPTQFLSASDLGGESASVSVAVTGLGVSITAHASTSSLQLWSSASASATVVARLAAPIPTPGTIQTTGFNGLIGQPVVDVGNDGQIDTIFVGFGQSPVANIPVVVGPAGIEVRIAASASASYPSGPPSATNTASFSFTANVTDLDVTMAACGPTVQGWYSAVADRWTMQVDGATGLAIGGFAIGLTRTPGIFVLPTGCPLANDVIVALRVPLDASGFGSFSLPIDPAGTRRTLYLQYLGVSDPVGGPWEFVSSNQVRADLPGTP